ncbi:hypothetical protein CcCBS67573_g05375 [Chytriomyces confervae]|uniref:Uncharacterized protein n=1 Tax=Chytriomyces confervae TaxID=246404 RepID=A0A507FAJ7_9FUNG|nr:hypothetical protein CcCBS67573_g05375 [Chytriomyces confervae]
MSPTASDKKRALLNTVAAISKTLDETEVEFPLLPNLPAKVPLKPPAHMSEHDVAIDQHSPSPHQRGSSSKLQQQTHTQSTQQNRNPSSIFSNPNVFDLSQSQPSLAQASRRPSAPMPQTKSQPDARLSSVRTSDQNLMKETVRQLEAENRKLQFEKAALVSTLIDIKPSQTQQQPRATHSQSPSFHVHSNNSSLQQPAAAFGGPSSAFKSKFPMTGGPVDSRATNTPNHFHYSIPLEHVPGTQVTGGVVDPGRSHTPDHVHYAVHSQESIPRQPTTQALYGQSNPPPPPQQQQQQPQSYMSTEEDQSSKILRRQALDIEALTSQCDILAKENKRLRGRTLELEEIVIGSASIPPNNNNNNQPNEDEKKKESNSNLHNELQTRLANVMARKNLLISTLEKKTHSQGIPLSEAMHIINTLSDAFAGALRSSIATSNNTTSFDALTPLNETQTLQNLDAAIQFQATKPDQPAPITQAQLASLESEKQSLENERAVLQDLAGMYLSELDTSKAFRAIMSNTLSLLHGQLRALAAESSDRIARADAASLAAAKEAEEAKKAHAEIAAKFDPDLVTVDFEKVIGPQMDKQRVLEFEVSRLKGVELTLESIIKEWKNENETLRRMVDEVSGVAGGSGEDIGSVRQEMLKLRSALEDERLKFAKAKEVIRVLKESFGDSKADESSDETALLDIDTLLAGGGMFPDVSKGVASQYAKALHDAIGRSVVDFDELVLLLGENNALKTKNSELVIRLEEQEKRLETSTKECAQVKETLSKEQKAHTSAQHSYESKLKQHDEAAHKTQQELTRLTTESAYYQDMTTSYFSQFSRIEQMASHWFDVKGEHHLQVEAQLRHNMGSRPHLSRLINFEGIFSRVVSLLKDTKESLDSSTQTLAKLRLDLETSTKSESKLKETCNHQKSSLETIKSSHDAQRLHITELEREVSEESGRRAALEVKLRKVVRAAMSMLEVPVDADVLGMHGSAPLKPSATGAKSSRLSPSRSMTGAI